jgi:hypothetical protein
LSKRIVYTTSLTTSGVVANSVTPHSKSSSPVEPVISCTTLPANVRPLLPCSRIIASRSSNGVAYQLAWASRRFVIG